MEQAKIEITKLATATNKAKKDSLVLDGRKLSSMEFVSPLSIETNIGTHTLSIIHGKKCIETVSIQVKNETDIIHLSVNPNNDGNKIGVKSEDSEKVTFIPTKNDKKKHTGGFAAVAVIVIFVIVFAIAATSSPDNTAKRSDESGGKSEEELSSSETQTENILYSDDNFTVSYVGARDDITGTMSAITMSLKLENRSDKNVLIVLENCYINDYAVQPLGGNIDLDGTKAGKNSVCPFLLGYADTGITGVKDIEKIEFRIKFKNAEDWEDILETDTITVSLKEQA